MRCLNPETTDALRDAFRWAPPIARPEQMEPPAPYDVWLILAGRGWGKSRTGAETVRKWVNVDGRRRIHLVGRTAADARDTMVYGESGIIEVCRGDLDNQPEYNANRRSIFWPNGAQALVFSAEKPDALRGPQCECWWADELAAWRYLENTWDNLQFGARLGVDVRGIVTTTPRPVKKLKELLDDEGTITHRGSTLDNAENLAPNFLRAILRKYRGTRLGRQEINAEILDDNPNALWRRAMIDETRTASPPGLPRVVVALDPAASSTGNEAGIVAVGHGDDGDFYVLDDRSLRASPDVWASETVAAYHRQNADCIVYETNQGGDMVKNTLRTVDQSVPVAPVRATRGKYTRAEPVAALYEQGRVHHVGIFAELEDQMCEWEPGSESPDRLDALVWGLTYLSQGSEFSIS